MDIVGWRLYYGDGSTAEGSDDAAWEAAPREGVQALVAFYELFDKYSRRMRTLYHGSPGNGADYYWAFGAGMATEVPEGAAVKYGRMIEKADFLAIYNRALSDYTAPGDA